MPDETILKEIDKIKDSIQYRILTPEIKVLIELYQEPSGIYTNELARRMKGKISKTSIQKALLRLSDQGLIKSSLEFVKVSGVDHPAKNSRISGEATQRYVEKLVDAIYATLSNKGTKS